MKIKAIIVAAFAFAFAVESSAQTEDKNMFNHVAVGVSLGTTGIGIDAAAPIGNYVQVRAGVDFFPNIKMSTDLDISTPYSGSVSNIPSSVEVEGKAGFTNGKLLFDVYPFRSSSFHVTAGAYFGSSKIVRAYNKENGALSTISDYNNQVEAGLIPGDKIGVELGDYLLEPDDKGNVEASIKTLGFKPYLGIGFGRAVPKKRIGFMFDLGVQFWGSPKVYCFDHELTESDVEGEDGGLIKTLSKITVYPVINFRLCGRIL